MRINGSLSTFLTPDEVVIIEELGGRQLFEANADSAIRFRAESVVDNEIELKNLLKQFELLTDKKQPIYGFQNAIKSLRKTRLPIITLHFSANRLAGKLYTTPKDDSFQVFAGVIVDMSGRARPIQKSADWDGSAESI